MTKIINKNELDLAKKSLEQGNLVIFPTETVYGLGANALNKDSVDKIFEAKNRASNNPLIVHLKDKSDIEKYAVVENSIEQKLIDAFMPGPFTLILKKKSIIPDNVTCNLDTVGIRIPIDNIAHLLLEKVDFPIAAPSANLSTKPSGTKVSDIYDEFNEKVDFIIDSGESVIGLESTVVKVIDNVPVILRPGFITKEDIVDVIGTCNVSEFVLKEASGKVESPGMLYKHYSPNTPCILVDREEFINVVNDYKNKKVIIIGSKYLQHIPCYKYFNYGDNLVDVCHNIFSLLRKADNVDADIILIEATKKEGLGLAIMNRLIRTCSYHYVRKNENS